MNAITTAVLLAAGEGSRLRAVGPYKPLCPVAGKPLIDRALEGLAAAGLTRAVVVLGYGIDAIGSHLDARTWPIAVETVASADWRLPNGVSLAAARDRLAGQPALLAMCDHLVDPRLYGRVAEAGAGEGLRLGIDRRLDNPLVDPDDVTRVRTEGERIVAIGKGLASYDAYDTGVFAIAPAMFAVLGDAATPSISDGVAALAARGAALTIDCGDLGWIDVDDGAALAHAERWLAGTARRDAAGGVAQSLAPTAT